jgi:hypothetical protein
MQRNTPKPGSRRSNSGVANAAADSSKLSPRRTSQHGAPTGDLNISSLPR